MGSRSQIGNREVEMNGTGINIDVGTLIMYLIQAIILILMILLVRMFRNGGPKDENGKKRFIPNPGYGTKCIEHEGTIIKHETSIEYIVKTLESDQRTIKELDKKVDNGFFQINRLIQKALKSI